MRAAELDYATDIPDLGNLEQLYELTDVAELDATDHGETLPRATADPASFVCRFCPYQGACWQP